MSDILIISTNIFFDQKLFHFQTALSSFGVEGRDSSSALTSLTSTLTSALSTLAKVVLDLKGKIEAIETDIAVSKNLNITDVGILIGKF